MSQSESLFSKGLIRCNTTSHRACKTSSAVFNVFVKKSVCIRVQKIFVRFERFVFKKYHPHGKSVLFEQSNNALHEELASDPTGANFATTENSKNPTIAKFAIVQKEGGRLVTRQVEFYSLDVVLSVGYRVKSNRGIQFRRWANVILRQYLLQGYSVNRHLIALQENMDKRMTRIEDTQAKQQQQLDFFIRTSTPPAEMVFFEGDFYTARVALENLVRSANHRVIIVDGYVSSLTLSVLDVRKQEVTATVYTVGVGQGMQHLMDEHDRLFPNNHIDIRKWRNESHDRWLIIDDSLYHCGHSLNANGSHKISAITLMGTSPEVILSKVE